MGRRTTSTSFLAPFKSDGVLQAEADATFGRGAYTLTSATTYYFELGGKDGDIVSAHLQWDSAIILTSVTVQDSNMPESTDNTSATGVTAWSSTAGDWISENPSTAFVGVAGAGVSATSGVVAATGGAQGGCMFHVALTGARRSRIAIVVGGTGGSLRCSTWAKE